jgi:AcrR family transcriptional regulator
MNTPTQRDVQAQERRNQLIDTALKLFAEKGVEHTTVKDIATAADVAQGLIYHYFKSKDDLLWAIIGREELLPEISSIFASAAERPAREVLVEVATRVHQLLTERQDLQAVARVVLREALIRPEMQQAIKTLQVIGLGLLTRYLDARIAVGELRPHNPEVTARMLAGAIVTLYLSTAPAEPFIAEMVETLLRGIAASG